MKYFSRIAAILFLAAFTTLLCSGQAQAAADLTIELGAQNAGVGLKVPSGGDGANAPETINGVSARRITGKHSLYLYVGIDHPDYAHGPRDLYVIVEAFDEGFARLKIQYDKDAPSPNLETKYTESDGSYLLTGSKQWQTCVFYLPQVRLGHGQNGGADFRLIASNLAIHKITVTSTKPAGYDPAATIDPARLKALQVTRPSGMEFTLGNDASPDDAALFKTLSATSVESYVDWAGVEPKEGQWDWSKWDRQTKILQAAKLKWVPFLIAGSAYATPLWFHDGPHSHYYRCLEHGRDSKVQSLFNPDFRAYVDRFIKTFAERYRDQDVIESVLLGISGIYGESIYPSGPEGEWTARLTGVYHNHAGWWANDPYAIAAFRQAMQKKYPSITALNQAWTANYSSFEQVVTFLPDHAASDAARADFVEWYQQSMTGWAAFWAETTRKYFPKTEIYLCTGGDGNPQLGADFTAQTKAVARYGVGVRITNEGSDYASNFTITREVATATRLYQTFCGFEPASQVDEHGVIARIFNASASGARQLHDYIPNMLTNPKALENFRAQAEKLQARHPKLDAALYLSRETWVFDPTAIHRTYDVARPLRDLTDIDFVTRQSVVDGALKDHRLLVLVESPVLDPTAAAAIEQFVRAGGTLITATRQHGQIGQRLFDNQDWRQRMLAEKGNAEGLSAATVSGEPPAHWLLEVGQPGDEDWLFGDWFNHEQGLEWSKDATKRWSGAQPGCWLPVKAGADYTLRLTAQVPGLALSNGGGDVLVNGQKIGRVETAGTRVFEWKVPARVLGSGVLAKLELKLTAWKPSEHNGLKDERPLGIAVRQIEWLRAGAEATPAAPATLAATLNQEVLKSLTRSVGRGWTITLPGVAENTGSLAKVLQLLLSDTPAYLPGVKPFAPQDGKLDKIYTTVTSGKTLRYDAQKALIY